MKKLLLLLTLFVSFNCIGQQYVNYKDTLGLMPIIGTSQLSTGYISSNFYSGTITRNFGQEYNTRIVSKYDTTVLYGGFISFKHTHDYARKNNKQISNISCAVYHGLEGCPDTWEDFNLICTSGCYRHLNVKEKRYTEVVKSEYEIALEKLHNLLKTNK